MTKKLIGIIGEQASGKGAVAKMIVEKYGATRLTTSDLLKKTLETYDLEFSRDNLTKLALALKDNFGNDVLMKALLKDARESDNETVIIDGIRMKGDTKPFEEAYGKDFKLIYVTANPKIRYERSKGRGEKAGEATQDFETFMEKEKSGTEKDIAEIGEKADFTVDNGGTMEELEKQIEDIINKIFK